VVAPLGVGAPAEARNRTVVIPGWPSSNPAVDIGQRLPVRYVKNGRQLDQRGMCCGQRFKQIARGAGRAGTKWCRAEIFVAAMAWSCAGHAGHTGWRDLAVIGATQHAGYIGRAHARRLRCGAHDGFENAVNGFRGSSELIGACEKAFEGRGKHRHPVRQAPACKPNIKTFQVV